MSFAADPDWARFEAERAALIRRRCGWCERKLRPCNLARHVAARHFRQLTIYDGLGGLVLPDDQAARWSEIHVEGERG